MSVVHFLNVGQGDCSIIQHASGRISVIDICNVNDADDEEEVDKTDLDILDLEDMFDCIANNESLRGNYQQKKHTINPIQYLQKLGIDSIFRFILTHPDMDHMSGFARLFDTFRIDNFWDTENTKTINSFKNDNDKADWLRYQYERKNALHIYDGEHGKYWNRENNGEVGGDCLQVLCPTLELTEQANQNQKYNDASYVILYNENGMKILFSGDAEKKSGII